MDIELNSKKTFLFVASFVSNKRKGFDLLSPIIEMNQFADVNAFRVIVQTICICFRVIVQTKP